MRILLFLFFLNTYDSVWSQAILSSNSFENISKLYWVNGTPVVYDFSTSSTFLFDSIGVTKSNRIDNVMHGMIKPVQGDCMIGLGFGPKGNDVAALPLNSLLEKDSFYSIELFLLNDYVYRSSPPKNIHLSFSKRVIGSERLSSISEDEKLIINIQEGLSCRKWKKATLIYRATGNEQTLLLGDNSGFSNKIFGCVFVDNIIIKKRKSLEWRLEERHLFDKNSFLLNAENVQIFDDWIVFLRANPNRKIEIQGHTDNEGNYNDNLALSEARANAVKKYFIDKGIPLNQLRIKGYSSSKPITSNETEKGRGKNRRVELFIIKEN